MRWEREGGKQTIRILKRAPFARPSARLAFPHAGHSVKHSVHVRPSLLWAWPSERSTEVMGEHTVTESDIPMAPDQTSPPAWHHAAGERPLSPSRSPSRWPIHLPWVPDPFSFVSCLRRFSSLRRNASPAYSDLVCGGSPLSAATLRRRIVVITVAKPLSPLKTVTKGYAVV